MPLNNAAMVVGANAIRAAAPYGQLHSAAAGASYTSNVTTAPRQPVNWGTPTGAGSFGLASQINFSGGANNGPVYSITLWSANSGGTCYGEFPLTGDSTFSSTGTYSVTAIDLTGTAS